MKNTILALGLVALAATTACTPESAKSDAVRASAAEPAVAPKGGSPGALSSRWAIAKVGSTDTQPQTLDVGLVSSAWSKVNATFYNGTDYAGTPLSVIGPALQAKGQAPFNLDEARQCLNACPDYYSDIMCHFYCWQPSYSAVEHNIRGCYSQIARGSFPNLSTLVYPQMYDYCTYQPFDAVKVQISGTPPPDFDAATIAKNKAAGRKLGVNAWVDDNEREAFKHVVFTWYDPMLYSVASQQKAINEFYGITLRNVAYGPTDTADVAACQAGRRRTAQDYMIPNGMECSSAKDYAGTHSRHPNWTAITAFMNSGDISLK